MSPFKDLYGQECLTPLRLANPNLFVPVAKETLEEMDCQLQVMRGNLKKTNDSRQKSYANLKSSMQEFKGGDQVFIQVKPKKRSLRLGKHKKLSNQEDRRTSLQAQVNTSLDCAQCIPC